MVVVADAATVATSEILVHPSVKMEPHSPHWCRTFIKQRFVSFISTVQRHARVSKCGSNSNCHSHIRRSLVLCQWSNVCASRHRFRNPYRLRFPVHSLHREALLAAH